MEYKDPYRVEVQSAPKQVVREEASFNVFFRVGGETAQIRVGAGSVPDFDHRDAINSVQDVLLAGGTGWEGAVLALVEGGRNVN